MIKFSLETHDLISFKLKRLTPTEVCIPGIKDKNGIAICMEQSERFIVGRVPDAAIEAQFPLELLCRGDAYQNAVAGRTVDLVIGKENLYREKLKAIVEIWSPKQQQIFNLIDLDPFLIELHSPEPIERKYVEKKSFFFNEEFPLTQNVRQKNFNVTEYPRLDKFIKTGLHEFQKIDLYRRIRLKEKEKGTYTSAIKDGRVYEFCFEVAKDDVIVLLIHKTEMTAPGRNLSTGATNLSSFVSKNLEATAVEAKINKFIHKNKIEFNQVLVIVGVKMRSQYERPSNKQSISHQIQFAESKNEAYFLTQMETEHPDTSKGKRLTRALRLFRGTSGFDDHGNRMSTTKSKREYIPIAEKISNPHAEDSNFRASQQLLAGKKNSSQPDENKKPTKKIDVVNEDNKKGKRKSRGKSGEMEPLLKDQLIN